MFRSIKSILTTRPICHKRDETIRGHVFCSFLALVLMCDLQDRMALRGWHKAEWADVLRDLDGLTETEVDLKRRQAVRDPQRDARVVWQDVPGRGRGHAADTADAACRGGRLGRYLRPAGDRHA